MWKEGTIGIPKKDSGYKSVKYWGKHFDEPNEDYGINGGKISKLSLKRISGRTIPDGAVPRYRRRHLAAIFISAKGGAYICVNLKTTHRHAL